MSREEILQKCASGQLSVADADKLLAEAEKSRPAKGLYCKVSQKGAVSVYGLQRMPVTLYLEQWDRLLEFGPEIIKFIEEHRSELSVKEKKAA